MRFLLIVYDTGLEVSMCFSWSRDDRCSVAKVSTGKDAYDTLSLLVHHLPNAFVATIVALLTCQGFPATLRFQ